MAASAARRTSLTHMAKVMAKVMATPAADDRHEARRLS
jgi:hypothetical protein